MSLIPVSRISLLVALSLTALAHAQTSITVAGFGYRNPANTITAAPGQIMMVSVFGIAARIPDPAFPANDQPIEVATNGLPTEVKGLSVDFIQGPVTVQMQIRGVQQSPCPSFGACSPATSLTVQIPYELNPESNLRAVLRIKEGGVPVAEVSLNPVTDSVHVINTCDQAGISLSLADGVPAEACVPMVMHARGPLVTAAAPARPGETLVLWAYGLGAVEHPIPDRCCASPDQLPLAIQPFNVNFSYADAGRFPLRRLGHMVPSYVGMVGAGLYQVHFVVPSVPSDISRCSGRSGNLNVLVSGPNSAGQAEICVQP